MNKKEHLIKSLKVAINALRTDIVNYDWKTQESCNMGVVSQAVLGITSKKLSKGLLPLFKKLDELGEKHIDHTWKNAVKYTCSITGKDLPDIISDLDKAGIGREDIVHLEYLENPAILALSGIDQNPIYGDVVVDKKAMLVKEPHPNLLFAFFGVKVSVMRIVPIKENKIIGYEYPKNYYEDKDNLIKYLVAWVSILENNNSFDNVKVDLEAKLLNAVVDEDYETAALLRDKISFSK